MLDIDKPPTSLEKTCAESSAATHDDTRPESESPWPSAPSTSEEADSNASHAAASSSLATHDDGDGDGDDDYLQPAWRRHKYPRNRDDQCDGVQNWRAASDATRPTNCFGQQHLFHNYHRYKRRRFLTNAPAMGSSSYGYGYAYGHGYNPSGNFRGYQPHSHPYPHAYSRRPFGPAPYRSHTHPHGGGGGHAQHYYANYGRRWGDSGSSGGHTGSSGGGSSSSSSSNVPPGAHTATHCAPPSVLRTRRSFGVLLYKESHDGDPAKRLYLPIRRKHTIGFEEVVRGHYEVGDLDLLVKLANDMTHSERLRILTTDTFTPLWYSVWHEALSKDDCDTPEFVGAQQKFLDLKRGVWTSQDQLINWATIFQQVTTDYHLPTMEFPKGRRDRMRQETNLECAQRELFEETNIPSSCYQIKNLQPVHETLTGINGFRYKYTYYIGEMKADASMHVYIDPSNINQVNEVSHLGWYTCNEILEMLRPVDAGRKNALLKVHSTLNSMRAFEQQQQQQQQAHPQHAPLQQSPSEPTGTNAMAAPEERQTNATANGLDVPHANTVEGGQTAPSSPPPIAAAAAAANKQKSPARLTADTVARCAPAPVADQSLKMPSPTRWAGDPLSPDQRDNACMDATCLTHTNRDSTMTESSVQIVRPSRYAHNAVDG